LPPAYTKAGGNKDDPSERLFLLGVSLTKTAKSKSAILVKLTQLLYGVMGASVSPGAKRMDNTSKSPDQSTVKVV